MREIYWNGATPYLYGVVLGYAIKGGLSGESYLWFAVAVGWIIFIVFRGPASFDYDTEGKPNA